MPAPQRLKERLDAHFGADIGVIISDSVGRPWRLGTVGLAIGAAGVPVAVGPARREGPERPAAGGDRGRASPTRWRRWRCWPWARPPRGAPRRWCAGSTGAPRCARPRRWCGPRPRTCSDEPAATASGSYVVLSGGSGGVKLAVGLAQLLRRAARRRRQHRRRFHAPRPAHLARCRHRALHPGRPGQRGDRLGAARTRRWTFMHALGELGGPTWFKLGDGDLADARRPHVAACARARR